ncbi:hypothetical protein [Clostridium pasteurianum]|uniref:DUF4878 domain-containing protein n=1 Tax=Clostridium pasteurianum BC1 TaxID=86416 RepID=R4KAI6_CLOPA|nr:hypothetical protein [Clostridium pasteurianum]AGK98721.1 hypothetical protein Clopa_3975 [Clostridium pasteurianum BC1]
MRKKTKVKKIYIVTAVFIIIIVILIKGSINNNNDKDINFAAKQYLTTGFFNSYKLYNIDHSYITFSSSNDAILNVRGMETRVPHATVSYSLKMTKDTSGIWHVKKISPLSDLQYLNANN